MAIVSQALEPAQPYLFDMGEPDPIKTAADREYRRAIDAVLRARRFLASLGQERGLRQINDCLENLRSISRFSDTQMQELILKSIEVQGATTIAEICEDARLAPVVVKPIIAHLIEQNTLYKVPRFIPGSDRQYFMFKSSRQRTPEVI